MRSHLICGLLAACITCTWVSVATAQGAPLPKENGYRGIWYYNQKTKDEYVYKYSGGLGTYCAHHNPFAVYAPAVNKTFFVYGGAKADKNELVHMISYYDHATGVVPRPTLIVDKQTDDAHDNPVLSMDGQGHLWVFSSSHGTSRPSYIWRSVEPYDIEGFEMVLETNYSYPQPWYIPGKGFLFLHTYYKGGRGLNWSTSADGSTWSDRKPLAHIEDGHYQVSWPCGERVGTAFNLHPKGLGLNFRTNLYYVETSDLGATWRTADGQIVETPLTTVANPALVHDYQSEGLKVYLADMIFDAQGRPIILYVLSKGWEPGPKNGPRTWTVAHWTGSEWLRHSVTESDNNYDMGSLYVEPDGVWRIIGPTEAGPQAYNPGGEIAVWESRNEGVTWTKARQLTHDSRLNHTYVRRPVNAHPGFCGLWADGHGRQPSESRLYFYDAAHDTVFQLPSDMDTDMAAPIVVK